MVTSTGERIIYIYIYIYYVRGLLKQVGPRLNDALAVKNVINGWKGERCVSKCR